MRLEFEHLLWLLIGNENCPSSFGNNVRGGAYCAALEQRWAVGPVGGY
jgi:hypothetical protein